MPSWATETFGSAPLSQRKGKNNEIFIPVVLCFVILSSFWTCIRIAPARYRAPPDIHKRHSFRRGQGRWPLAQFRGREVGAGIRSISSRNESNGQRQSGLDLQWRHL